MDDPCPRLKCIPPWLLRIRGIIVVGQPTAGGARRRVVQSIWSRADAIVMSTGAQDMDFGHAAREMLVLTKNDADPDFF